MIRTQVYIPNDLYYAVRMVAKRTKKKPAAVLRELLRAGLQKTSVNAGTTLLGISKIGIKGPRNFSSRIDDYLYS